MSKEKATTVSKDIFAFAGSATVLHLKARKEGPDDDKVLAVDLKLCGFVGLDQISRFDEGLPAFIWNDEGKARNCMIGPVALAYELEGYRMSIGLSNREYYGVKVKKFSIEPAGEFKHRAALTFAISFKSQADEVAKIAEFLQEDITITLEKAQQDLPLKGGGSMKPAMILAALLALAGCAARDDTDAPDIRSGFSLFTDYKTGCQYIGWTGHAITPRIGSDGRQICRAPGESGTK